MENKNIFINQIQENQNIEATFVLAEARQAQAKNGPFWALSLQDSSGSLPAKIWSPESNAYSDLLPGQFWRVRGRTSSYNGALQITVQSMVAVQPEEIELADFLPTSTPAPKELMAQLENILRFELKYLPWKKFCRDVLTCDHIRTPFLQAPGAKTIHHAYIGGLLEHTLNVCRVCQSLCEVYPQVDKDILLVAAAFHDLGKAFELTCGIVRDYTSEGRLLGHIFLGLERLTPFLDKNKELSPELKMHLKHLILSHHGELEFGSPKRPKTLEAFLLHHADNIDAKVNSIETALADQEEEHWSDYQRSLGRMLYKRKKTPCPQPRKAQTVKEHQATLFPF